MSKVWTPLCEDLGIKYPVFGFAHDVDVVAAITNSGGYGVYGATRRFPHEIEDELAQIKKLVVQKKTPEASPEKTEIANKPASTKRPPRSN